MRQAVKLIGAALVGAASLFAAANVQANGASAQQYWNEYLRYSYFKDRAITESEDVIQLHMPEQAEDPAIVPVSIYAMMPQTAERYIKQLTLIIDKNPVPMAGRFTFTPKSGRADVSLRIRVNEQTPVRAIAELSDGSLHMSQRFVKASGGCSAPLADDLEKALSRLGKMKLSVGAIGADDKPLPTKLRIKHPNITGLQTVGGELSPARFVKAVKVRYDDEVIFSAETDISISSDPTFGFYFVPSQGGEMIAEVTDSEGQTFTKTITVSGRTASD